eukprot:CAMPEP_0172364214 /NCGR_PEP_ID=MMETSP1060-20121228/7403_1 /TAXON_ID=37318 /ORGANISM="Pseudo-nitzschia pungens, Strain cf. cingulata" /LENGTH=373 /DNA_ID=CAMNT_0013087169 /DNA_START=110 /DNA_END=1231 /DNA_ORIENTATION=+
MADVATTTPSSNSATPTVPTHSGASSSSSSSGKQSTSSPAFTEDDLQRQLKSALETLDHRKPHPTYKKMLERNPLTRRVATIPKNEFYKRVGSRLRERVEVYTREMQGKDVFDRISQRKPMDESGMRAAFTLREAKAHEQEGLLEATLAAMAMHPERKRSLDGMALGLQQRHKKKMRSTDPLLGVGNSAIAQTQMAKDLAVLEQQKQQARQLEEARKEREREERRRKLEELEQNKRDKDQSDAGGSGNSKMQHVFNQVFKHYWDMEFPNLGGINPFRIVIDRKSAPQIAPDYFTVVTTPMNLTYIRDKVKGRKYTTLYQFFSDIDLMIDNALKYNQGDDNPYRIASEELKKKHTKIAKKVWKQIKEKQKPQNK